MSQSKTNHALGSGRIPELDGVRGIAILLVLIWHYLQNQIRAEVGSPLAYFKQAIGFSWSGVDLFFVLSGFLIAGILLDNRGKPHYFKTFYVRRICRIFPLYYLNLGLFVLFIALGFNQLPAFRSLFDGNNVPLWSYFAFMQNILMATHNSAGANWLSVTWSLAVEEQFYLFFPFLIRFFPVARLPLFFLWIIAMAVYMRVSLPGLSAYINTLWRADALMAGALLAYLVRGPVFLERARQFRLLILMAFILIAGAVVWVTLQGHLRLGGPLTHLSLAILYSLFILLALLSRDGLPGKWLRNRLLIWLGTISYGVYILHTGISRLVHALVRNASPSMASWSDAATTLLALMVTLLMAHLSYYWFERKFIRIGHAISYGK